MSLAVLLPSTYKPHILEARGWPFKILLVSLGKKLTQTNCALVQQYKYITLYRMHASEIHLEIPRQQDFAVDDDAKRLAWCVHSM